MPGESFYPTFYFLSDTTGQMEKNTVERYLAEQVEKIEEEGGRRKMQ